MKKRYKVRFYKAHDLDLITYMASHSINLQVTLYYVLQAYCHGTVVGIQLPEQTGPRPSEYNMIYYTNLSLDTEKDKKMIEFIDGIKPGFRNNFMKNLLRQYLCTPLVQDFLVSPADYGKVEQTTRMLQGGRNMVDIDYEAYKEAQKGTAKKTKALRKREASDNLASTTGTEQKWDNSHAAPTNAIGNQTNIYAEEQGKALANLLSMPASVVHYTSVDNNAAQSNIEKDGEKLGNGKQSDLLDNVLASLAESQGVSKKEIEDKLALLLGNSAVISKDEQNKSTSSGQEQQEMTDDPVNQPTEKIQERDMGAHPHKSAEEGSIAPMAADEEPEEDDDLTDAFSQILSM